MSKKIVALVLFVAMMVMMVPGVNAAFTSSINFVALQAPAVGSTYWYYNEAPKAAEAGTLGNSYDFGGGEVGVKWDDKTNTSSNTLTITISAKYSVFKDYYFGGIQGITTKSKMILVPIRLDNKSGADMPYPTDPDPSAQATAVAAYYLENDQNPQTWAMSNLVINGASSHLYMIGGECYLRLEPTEAGNEMEYLLQYVSGGITHYSKVKLVYKNTEAPTVTGTSSIKVVAKGGAQAANYNVSETKGVITIAVAALTKEDCKAIVSAKGTDAAGGQIVLTLQPLDKDGNPFAARTVISTGNATYDGLVLAKSEKYVTVVGGVQSTAYFLDANGCFKYTVAVFDSTILPAPGANVAIDLTGYASEATIDNVSTYFAVANPIALNVYNAATPTTVSANVILKKTDRVSSEIDTIDASVVVKVGETKQIAYTITNAAAFVTTPTFKAIQPTIAKVDAKGIVTGVKVGKTYVTAEIGSDIEVIVVEVVEEYPAEDPVVEGVQYVVTASNLHARTGAGTSNSSLGLLPRGTIITVTATTDNGWAKHTFKDVEAYSSMRYLSEVTAD